MRLRHFLSVSLFIALTLSACQPADEAQSTAASTPAATDAVAATSAPTQAAADTQPPAGTQVPAGTAMPVPTGKPPQTNAAEIRPPDRRAELTRISALLEFKVTGLNGVPLGEVADYVVNTCETYLVYILMDPAPELKVAAGKRLLIPFEAVTINSGALDAEQKAIALYLVPQQLSAAPAVESQLQLLPTTWEDGVRNYWKQVVRVGKLSTECHTSAGSIQKIAYASELLGAELKDGNGNWLGTVVEGILEPESGKLGYYVVNLKADGGLVMVPLGKTNIPNAALTPGTKVDLVLLAENGKLNGAPHLSAVEDASSADVLATARNYWGS